MDCPKLDVKCFCLCLLWHSLTLYGDLIFLNGGFFQGVIYKQGRHAPVFMRGALVVVRIHLAL